MRVVVPGTTSTEAAWRAVTASGCGGRRPPLREDAKTYFSLASAAVTHRAMSGDCLTGEGWVR